YLFVLIRSPHPDVYTLSLHDALPIYHRGRQEYWIRSWRGRLLYQADRLAALDQSFAEISQARFLPYRARGGRRCLNAGNVPTHADRKSTRLNSSHSQISYAVICLKKK